jgi:hypothetical protein
MTYLRRDLALKGLESFDAELGQRSEVDVHEPYN